MKQDWSKWLGLDLDRIAVNNDTVSEVASRMYVIQQLKEGTKVLGEVNKFMREITGAGSALVYTHRDVVCDEETVKAYESLVTSINEVTDAGKWPTAWEGNSLKTMALVLTGLAGSIKTDFKALVTLASKAYCTSFGEDAMIEAAKAAPAFAQQFIMGTALSLNLSAEQTKAWSASYNMTTSVGPHDVIRSLFALTKTAANDALVEQPVV